MAFNFEFPYTDSNRYNDDWLISMMKKLIEEFNHFVNLNKIKYADPILWDITHQYEVNTVVIDPETGDAYISTHAVPYGISLGNTEYWTKIFNYARVISVLQQQIAAVDEGLSKTATANRSAGELVWLNGLLYEVTRDMIAGDTYVVNSNCKKVTIENYINGKIAVEALGRESQINNLMEEIAPINERTSQTATGARTVGQLVWLNYELYEITADMNEGDTYIVNTNCKKVNIENYINGKIAVESYAREQAVSAEESARILADNNLQSQIDELDLPRRMIIMGDSWATGFKSGVPGSYLASPWPNQVQTFFGLSNDDCYILRINGASFTNSNPTLNFEHMLTEAASTIEDAATITDILVCAGNNEMSKSTAEIVAAIDSFAAYCRNIYPNAKVEIGMIGGGKCTDVVCYDNVTRSSVYCFYEYSLKGYERGANKNINCRYLNGVQYACRQNVYSYFGYDNTDQHPDQAGQNQIASAIITALRNGVADVLGFTNSMSLTAGSNVSVVTFAPWYNRLINNIVSIGSHGVTELTLQDMTDYVCDGNHEIELFNIGGGSICGVSEGTQKYVLPCYLLDGDNAFHTGNVAIWFDKQKVKATIISMGATGWLTKTLASLWIPKFAFEIDSMTC